ncbi:ABC transporter ATP-binding protein [Thermobrachium celere]|uniref:ABC transporter ATP-binding protein n=1 Tax=Thermobrachium celere DSM 8682 TaxID=941824 RepID=R7RTY0_9CLOT|nr:ABC transporter ATP-binding protein [Thermobrachium celere]CDF58768.1 ABC transporter ATP-binding protein [Thermobrachium celere DSM 8682]
MCLIKLENIYKTYSGKKIFEGFNLEIKKGEFLGIMGPSGSGKTTLLNIIGLLEECDEGKVIIYGEEIKISDRKKVRNLLKNKIGYLFQNFALIDDLTVYENLKIVLENKDNESNRKIMLEALDKVQLGDILDKKIYELSGGEQQRVAIARLILKKSEIILADEPTGSLDKVNSKKIMELLKELHSQGKTIIIVTHDENIISYCSRIINLV